MNKYKTIIWDLDGTLLDTLDDLMDSVNAALAEFGLPLRTKTEIRSFVGNGVLRLLELSVPNGKLNPQFDKIFAFFNKHYAKNNQNKTRPYDGVQKLLSELKDKGYKMAIATNKVDYAAQELTELYFKDAIDVTIGDSEGIRRKPHPDKVFEAIKQLNADKESSVYVGDSEVDIETACNAGIDIICVSWGFRDKEDLIANGAERIADTMEELLGILA